MNKFFYCLFGLLSFNLFSSCDPATNQLTDDEKIVNQITAQTATEIKNSKNLILIGTGGQMMYDIQMLAMSFTYYQEVDLKTARELIVYAVSKYLFDINNNQEVRQYLANYPFTAKNVEIMILVYGPDRLELPLEKIYCIQARRGKLSYYSRLDDDNPVHEETFEEAVHKNRRS